MGLFSAAESLGCLPSGSFSNSGVAPSLWQNRYDLQVTGQSGTEKREFKVHTDAGHN